MSTAADSFCKSKPAHPSSAAPLSNCTLQEAVESAGTTDDTQWLVYWLISAFLTIVERFAYKLLFRIPLYSEIKLLFIAFLVLPQFSGAQALYDMARPYIIELYNTINSSAQELKSDDPRAKSARGGQIATYLLFRTAACHDTRLCDCAGNTHTAWQAALLHSALQPCLCTTWPSLMASAACFRACFTMVMVKLEAIMLTRAVCAAELSELRKRVSNARIGMTKTLNSLLESTKASGYDSTALESKLSGYEQLNE